MLFLQTLIQVAHRAQHGEISCRVFLYGIRVYLIDVLNLGANVLLFSQTLTDAPVRIGKDDFVWVRNTATEKHRYLSIMCCVAI